MNHWLNEAIRVLAAAACLLFIGYNGIRFFYDGVWKLTGDVKSFTPAFAFLLLLGFLTGNGGVGGLTAAMNSTAKSFPPSSVSNSFVRKRRAADRDSNP